MLVLLSLIHILTYGDGVCDVEIDKLIEFHRNHGKLATLTAVKIAQDKGVPVSYTHLHFISKSKVMRWWGLHVQSLNCLTLLL